MQSIADGSATTVVELDEGRHGQSKVIEVDGIVVARSRYIRSSSSRRQLVIAPGPAGAGRLPKRGVSSC